MAVPDKRLHEEPPWTPEAKAMSVCFTNGHKEQCSLSDISLILKEHQAEVMRQLQEWMTQHEHHLRDLMMNLEGQVSSPPSSPLLSPKKCRAGQSPNLLDDNDVFGHQISSGSIAAGRRLSIDSTGSTASAKYISVEDLRRQCIKRGESDLFSKSKTFSYDFEQYCCSGMASKLRSVVNNVSFELLFATLIFVNSVLLGVEVAVVSSNPTEEVPHLFYYLTILFTAAFLVELIMRLVSEGGLIAFLFYCELRMWNWFDLFVVGCSLIEVGFNFVLLGGGSQSVTRIVRMARMTRLGRVLRVARIVRFVSQLRVLVISIVSTLQTLLWALFLLVIIIYVFAVLLAQATAEYFSEDPGFDRGSLEGSRERLDHYWGSLHAAMYTLFMSVAGGVSWEGAVFAIAEVHWVWGAFFTCFIAFASFALINVMTAVFCQSAIESAQRSLDVKWQKMYAERRKHIDRLKGLFKSLGDNTEGTISVKKLQKCWDNEAMQQFLLSMDLAPDDCWTFFTILDANRDRDVSASEFVDGCLRLKGSAKAFDMAVMTYELRHLSKQNIKFMNHMQESINMLLMELIGGAIMSESERPAEESHGENGKGA